MKDGRRERNAHVSVGLFRLMTQWNSSLRTGPDVRLLSSSKLSSDVSHDNFLGGARTPLEIRDASASCSVVPDVFRSSSCEKACSLVARMSDGLTIAVVVGKWLWR